MTPIFEKQHFFRILWDFHQSATNKNRQVMCFFFAMSFFLHPIIAPKFFRKSRKIMIFAMFPDCLAPNQVYQSDYTWFRHDYRSFSVMVQNRFCTLVQYGYCTKYCTLLHQAKKISFQVRKRLLSCSTLVQDGLWSIFDGSRHSPGR